VPTSKRSKVFEFLGIDCHLTAYSSANFLITWLLNSSYHLNQLVCPDDSRRSALVCPFVDNNGYKCENIREFFLRCQEIGLVYDPAAKEGTVILPLSSSTMQVLSVMCFCTD
jgi:hypothetical protein